MSNSKISLENQFGEVSFNTVLPGGTTLPALEPIAAHTVVMNNTGSTASASAVAVQAVSNALPAKTGVTVISAEGAASAPTNSAQTIALSTSNTYTDAAVNSAVNTALATINTNLNTALATTNTNLNAAITQINAILAALKVVS